MARLAPTHCSPVHLPQLSCSSHGLHSSTTCVLMPSISGISTSFPGTPRHRPCPVPMNASTGSRGEPVSLTAKQIDEKSEFENKLFASQWTMTLGVKLLWEQCPLTQAALCPSLWHIDKAPSCFSPSNPLSLLFPGIPVLVC